MPKAINKIIQRFATWLHQRLVAEWAVHKKGGPEGPPSLRQIPALSARRFAEMGGYRLPFSVSEPKIFPYEDGFLSGPIAECKQPNHPLSRVRTPRFPSGWRGPGLEALEVSESRRTQKTPARISRQA